MEHSLVRQRHETVSESESVIPTWKKYYLGGCTSKVRQRHKTDSVIPTWKYYLGGCTSMVILIVLLVATSLICCIYQQEKIVLRHQTQSAASFPRLDGQFSFNKADRINQSLKSQTTRSQLDISSEFRPSPIEKYLHPGNPLPNYILIGRTQGLSPLDYHEGAMVFLHHNKAAGTTVKTCLNSMHRKNILKHRPIVVTQFERVNLNDRFQNGSLSNHDIDVFMGGYVFGLCRYFTNQRNCSYFTFLRDPVDRVISSYFYCMDHPRDQLCGPIPVKNLTLQEWAIYQGSYFYFQLLVDPAICRMSNIKAENTFVPCWFKERTYFAQNVTSTDRQTLLNYILANLDKWFSVIGLTEAFETSIVMISHTYSYSINVMDCHSQHNAWHRHSRIGSHDDGEFADNQHESHEKTKQAMRILLRNDPAVMKALEFDIKIYNEGKRLFQRQNELFSHIND